MGAAAARPGAPGREPGAAPQDAGEAGVHTGGGQHLRRHQLQWQHQHHQQSGDPGAQEAARRAADAPRRSLTGRRCRGRSRPSSALLAAPSPARVPSPVLSSPPAARLSGGGAWGQGADLHAAAAAAACAGARRRRSPRPRPRPARAAPCLWRGPRGGEGEDRLLG